MPHLDSSSTPSQIFRSFAQRVIAEFVGCTMNVAPLEPRSGHPDRKAVRVMVTTGVTAAPQFKTRWATELGGEHHNDIIHQATLFQILNQTGDGQVDRFA